MYLNILNSVDNLYWLNKDKSKNFTEIPYEFLFSENAICYKFNYFDFMTSSSEIEGYTSIQTYYIMNKSNKYTDIKCSIFNGECSCIPVMSKEDREILKKSNSKIKDKYNNV
jgi:hypothetical protein